MRSSASFFDSLGISFALVLFLLLLATFALWLADKLVFRKQRAKDAKDPWWVEYGASFFPVILVVFILRSFIFEPFKIPSGSMIPTLLVGDFILVNKYTYGIRLPIINKKVIEIGNPQRGDVMVFRYPEDTSKDYIKRVVGLPGDKIAYQNKKISINGQVIPLKAEADYQDVSAYHKQFTEKLGETEHRIIQDPDSPAFITDVATFPFRDKCLYNNAGLVCEVPPGHYFMMGDNRDNSRDSRYWGFVPDENIVGRAFFVWFNWSDLTRIGSFR